jgi:hypothetical protein
MSSAMELITKEHPLSKNVKIQLSS